MKKITRFVLATVIFLGATVLPLESKAAGSVQFKDVPSSHWAKSAIDAAVQKGYFKGYSDGTFRPNATITRAEFAALLSRLSKNEVKENQGEFQDVKGHWAESFIKQAVGMGFISMKDYSSGFQPKKALTRREMAKWMASGLAANDADYKKALADTSTESTLVPVAEFYKGGLSKTDYPYVSVALGTGLMAGYPDGTFGPSKTTTRAETAVILSRLDSVQVKKADSFKDLNEMREVGLTGTNLTSATPFVYAKLYNSSELASFDRVINKEFNLKNGLGTMKVHRMIVADATSSKTVRNLYGKMFIDEEYNRPIDSDRYEVFVEATVIPSGDNLKNLAFYNSTGSRLTSGNNFESGTIKKYGIINLPHTEYVTSGFFTKGVERRFWMNSSINRSWVESITENGGRFSAGKEATSFYIPK